MHRQIEISTGPLYNAGAELYEQTVSGETAYYVRLNAWQSDDYRKAVDAEKEALSYLKKLEQFNKECKAYRND